MNTLLKINDVSYSYHTENNEILAVSGLNLTVNKGEFVSVIGPSGCGKSTVLNLIAGLFKPTQGEILLNDSDVNKNSNIGYMLQKDHLFNWRTVLSNVLLPLEIKKIKTKENVNYGKELLSKYGLSEFANSYPNELSGGMKQRVALIRTLIFKPSLLLLDEPFSALDYQTRLNVAEDVYKIIRSEKQTAILVTHDISEAVSLSDKVFVLTKRPTKVKKVHTVPFNGLSPLGRRKSAEFSKWFDLLYKELIKND